MSELTRARLLKYIDPSKIPKFDAIKSLTTLDPSTQLKLIEMEDQLSSDQLLAYAMISSKLHAAVKQSLPVSIEGDPCALWLHLKTKYGELDEYQKMEKLLALEAITY